MSYVWELLSAKTDSGVYPDAARPEVVELVEGSPRRALEIGCHRGAVGAALKQRFPGLHYVGIEKNPETAKAARERLDEVICEEFQSLDVERHPAFAEPFDMVVLADILEHLYDPWQTLRKLAARLIPGGRVYASVPNVRNAWLIEQLIQGNWSYEPAGLLDITHIRFFTLRECLKMFQETGFRTEKVATVRDPRVNIQGDFTRPITLTNPNYTLNGVDRQTAAELSTLQFLFVLSRA